jgi:hypothetical protein
MPFPEYDTLASGMTFSKIAKNWQLPYGSPVLTAGDGAAAAFSRIRHPRFRHDFPVHGSPFSGMNFSVCSSGKNRVRIPNLGSRSLIFSAFF